MSNDVIGGELTEDNNGKWLWRTADGRYIPVEEMADNHLRNAAMFLMGMGYAKCIATPQQCVVWLRIFRIEWEQRMYARAEANKWKARSNAYDAQKELDESKPERKQLR